MIHVLAMIFAVLFLTVGLFFGVCAVSSVRIRLPGETSQDQTDQAIWATMLCCVFCFTALMLGKFV